MATNQRSNLTVQVFVDRQWRDAGEVVFRTPERGLVGVLSFYYSASYAEQALAQGYSIGRPIVDDRALSVNAPTSFEAHYHQGVISPVLRDIMPHGFARRLLTKRLNLPRRAGPCNDFELISKACVAPTGNLRIKEAAQEFEEALGRWFITAFSRSDIKESKDPLSELTDFPSSVLVGALGAGGDAPKLLVVEDSHGKLYLEGTLPESAIKKHWLIKFPRNRMTETDKDILRAEGIFYRALSECGINTIQGAELLEGRIPTLWLPRFDRSIEGGFVRRRGLESMYCLNRMLGDGARMFHEDVLHSLKQGICRSDKFDEALCDYLVRDIVNFAIGNSDNHGRNTAILKTRENIPLSPAYDLAPMVLDGEGVIRSTIWSKPNLRDIETPNYSSIIRRFASDPKSVRAKLTDSLSRLSCLGEKTRKLGLPTRVTQHRRVKLEHPEAILSALHF